MQSKAATVEEYLASLPPDRREALSTLRKVLRKNLDKTYQEGMGYGMMGYSVPHSVFPYGYHCDPRQPLPFCGMASQKNHLSLYMMCVYGHEGEADEFKKAWAKTGKKLDMGKCCIRFRKIDDLALDVIADTLRKMPAKKFIQFYCDALARMGKGPDGKPLKKGKPAAKAGTKRMKPKAK